MNLIEMQTPTHVIMTQLAEQYGSVVIADWMYDTKDEFITNHGQKMNDLIIKFLKQKGVSRTIIEVID